MLTGHEIARLFASTEQVISSMVARRKRLRLALGLACGLLVAACGDDALAPGEEGVGEGDVGPAGGVVETDDANARVRIPEGALQGPTRITIRRLAPDEIPPVLGARRLVSSTYRFGPDGLVFQQPVRNEIFFDADRLPTGVELAYLTLGRLRTDGEVEELTDIQILTLPLTGRAALHVTKRGIGGLISSFSPFAVWVDE
jgi:hypothetical protein